MDGSLLMHQIFFIVDGSLLMHQFDYWRWFIFDALVCLLSRLSILLFIMIIADGSLLLLMHQFY